MRFVVRVLGLVTSVAIVSTGLVDAASGATAPAVATSVTVTSGIPATPAPRRLVTGWLPYWNMSAAMSDVSANANIFTDVSPFWFDARGSAPNVYLVNETYGISVPTVVAKFHSLGLKVLPTITDGTGWRQMAAQLSTSSGRTTMVGQLVALTTAINADGVDLDWEQFAFNDGSSTWPTTRPNWILFVKSLAAAMHAKGKLVSITVPAGNATSSDSTGYWVYAWSAIGPVIDRLRIMTYDYSPSTPGPIGPYPWVDAVASYAVTQVTARKVQIGVASYGRDWVWSSSGSCPTVAPAGASATQTATFLDNISWARQSHEYDSRTAAGYVSSLFTGAIATMGSVGGISLPQAPVSSWDSYYKERTFPYQVKFAGRSQPATFKVTAIGGLAGGTRVQLASTSGVVAGAAVSGTGIATGTHVASISGNLVTLTAANATSVTGVITFTTSSSASVTASKGTTVITVPSTTSVAAGMTVSGTGITAGTTVKSVTTDSTTSTTSVTLSLATTAAMNAVPVTFTKTVKKLSVGGVAGTTQIQVTATGLKSNSGVSGSGIGAGAKVSAMSGHIATLSVANAGNVTGTLSVTPPPVPTACTISRVGWYSEAQAAAARATLVDKYHLGGIAEWTIGGEDPAQWSGLTAYAQAIAAWPSVVSATGPALLGAGAASGVSGSVTYRGKVLSGAPVAIRVLKLGTTAWTTVATTTTDANGHFNASIPGQSANFAWRATAAGDGWLRLPASATGSTTVPVPPVITPRAPRTLLPGQSGVVSAVVRFNNALLANVVAALQVQRLTATTWTTVGTGTTSSLGTVSIPLPGQAADFRWRLTIPGYGAGRLPGVASGTTGIAVPPVGRLSASGAVNYLSPNLLRGTITFKGAPVVAKLTVQVLPTSATRWVTVATPTTSSTGAFAVRLPGQRANYKWRVIVPSNGYTRLATAFVRGTGVRVQVSASARWPVIATWARPVVRGYVTPLHAGYTVVLRRWNGRSWVIQASGLTLSSGYYSLTGTAVPRGTFRYLVVGYPPAGQPNLPGFSVVVSVTAS